jgi:hypothetical protein
VTPTAVLPPRTVEEIVQRAERPDFDRWAEQVARCGHCSRPVRLRGRVEHRSATGQQIAYSTETKPDQVLHVRGECGPGGAELIEQVSGVVQHRSSDWSSVRDRVPSVEVGVFLRPS